jgi:hypothetical protein
MSSMFSVVKPSGISTLKIKIVIATPNVASVSAFILLISSNVGFMIELLQNADHEILSKCLDFS